MKYNNSSNPVIAIRDENEVGTTDISMTPSPQRQTWYLRAIDRDRACRMVIIVTRFPGPYFEKIQAGEFFVLSEQLPKNISTNNQPDDALVLTRIS